MDSGTPDQRGNTSVSNFKPVCQDQHPKHLCLRRENNYHQKTDCQHPKTKKPAQEQPGQAMTCQPSHVPGRDRGLLSVSMDLLRQGITATEGMVGPAIPAASVISPHAETGGCTEIAPGCPRTAENPANHTLASGADQNALAGCLRAIVGGHFVSLYQRPQNGRFA